MDNSAITKSYAEKLWRRYTSPRNEAYLYAADLLPLVDRAAGYRTYLFSSEVQKVPGVKTIMASINSVKPNKARFDRGVATLIRNAHKIWP